MRRFITVHTFRTYAVALTVLVLLISALLTTFSILDMQYRVEHYSDSLQVKEPIAVPDSWYAMPAKVMTYVSIFLPLIVTIGFSLSYFLNTEGRPKERYLKAFGLSCLIFPLIGLQYLPWTIYQAIQTPGYLRYDEFIFVLVWLPFYCALVVVLSLGLNGFAWFREKRSLASLK